MAGGNVNSTKQDGILIQAELKLQSNYTTNHLSRNYKTIKCRNIDHQHRQELKSLYLHQIGLLQQNINRIFSESLYCDLNIIHGYKVIQTNQCIVKIRSPWFYKVLKSHFSYKNQIAYCYVTQIGIYQEIKNFVRLLYSNLDVSNYERFIIQTILNASCLHSDIVYKASQRKFAYNKTDSCYMNYCSFGDETNSSINEKSSTSSDMADSGLESGSMVSPQETVSENSSTDLDEPNESKSSKKKDEKPKNSEDSSRDDLVKDEISEYENRVLSDPFYDSNDESDNEEQANSYEPTTSFKFTESNAVSLAGRNYDDKLHRGDKTAQNGKKSSVDSDKHGDKNNSSSSSNYYFIDASSLNDDMDLATTSIVGYPNDYNGSLTWSNSQSPNSCYISSSRSNNFFHNDETFKLANRKGINAQNRFEEVNEFEQNLKLSEYLEPYTEPRMIKKLDSLLVQDDLNGSCKNANKESLVVEIKEADSGESAQHSPCPDNTKVDGAQKGQAQPQEQEEPEDRQPSLIRRNTFELDSNDEKLSSLRQEYERRQGSLVFQNSITQYSQHRIDGDPYLDHQDELKSLDKYDLDTVEKESKSYEVACSIARSSSDKFLACDYDLNDEVSFNSLPVHVNEESCPVKSKLKRNEGAPIISGGASSSDFKKPVDSPIVKRRTESTPIVSGGSVIVMETQAKEKPKSSMSSSMTAWVVDMSDCRTSDKSTRKLSRDQQVMSASFSSSSNPEKDKDKDKHQHSSLGYFVNLEDTTKSPKEKPKLSLGNHRRRASDVASEKNYCEFFVDLSDKSVSPVLSQKTEKVQQSDSKKNIFSMFIDLNEPTTSRVAKSSSSSGLSERKDEEKKPKSGVFMFIESDSPIVRRRTLSSSRPAFKRHSWNTDKSVVEQTQPVPTSSKQAHKRAHSFSAERGSRKIIGNASSHSLNETITSSLAQESQEQEDEIFDYDVRDTPPNSHVEIVNEELLVSLKNRNYQELDAITEQVGSTTAKAINPDERSCSESTETNRTRKSETFDISSSASGPSSASDNLEYKLNDLLDSTQKKLLVSSKGGKANQDKHPLRNNEKVAHKNLSKANPPASFVRLSDLDKRPLSNSTNSNVFTGTNNENSSYRLSNSVTETSWIESKLVMSARANEPLHRTVTKKLPLSIATGISKSENFDEFGIEGDVEPVISESDISSLQSSMGRSGQGSTEETETSTSFAIGRPYNRLGEDLLRMFLEEINTDVTIDVGGRQIKAHKCILSSRCQYFAAILSGGWVENAGNIISLQGYSYNAVHFALCHIYSGESCIPDTISILELATLADMLCLEGLKEVVGYTLKVKYCHLFHKPCNGCVVGVLECMPLAAAYGLDEVYRKSLRWVMRHFVRVWPTKEFATLPRELMDKCYHQHIVHMSTDNVLQTIMDCDKLLTTLPNVRWAEPVFRLVSNLLDASMKYLTDNYVNVLSSDSFLGLDRELTWNISRLEDHLLAAAERLAPEQACKAYSKLDKMFTLIDDPQRTPQAKWSPLFSDLMNKIRAQVEKCLVRDAARAARTNAWLKMDLDLRRRIQQLACLVILPNEVSTKRPSRHSNFLKEPKDRQETKAPTSRTPPNRNLDLRRVKMAISEHNDRTLKQTPLLQTRKIMNKPKTDPLERKLQSDKLSNDMNSVLRPKSWPNKMEVKSRYLEPRNRLTTKDTQVSQEKTPGQQRRKIMISSSDSSRTSSPAMKRAAEKKTLSKMTKTPMKKDGKALSSDSLTESSSRLSLKKDVASKSCGITRPESPMLKPKEIEPVLSIDSLAEPKKKTLTKKTSKMDTSMSTDSLMTDVTAITTPKSIATNKSSPILSKAMANLSINQTRSYEKLKKSSPPAQQRNTPQAFRRPTRSLESSTAASRSRAAAVVNAYQGSLNLRKSLLDAAKAPDIPSKVIGNAPVAKTNLRQSMRSSFASLSKFEKKEESTNNQRSSSSPASKRSPKSNINSRLTRSTIATNKSKPNEKSSNKGKTTGSADGPKFLNQSSRSGTFLKDEPTILNKSDIETAAIDV